MASKTPSERLKWMFLNFNLVQSRFAEANNIPRITLTSWINGRINLAEKSAKILVNGFANYGIFCNKEWLLYGKGALPFRPDSSDRFRDEEIKRYCSRLNSPIVLKVSDNKMEPFFYENDILVGDAKLFNNLEAALGYVCLIIIKNNSKNEDEKEISVGTFNCDGNTYFLTFSNPQYKDLRKVVDKGDILGLAPILWIRRETPKMKINQ